MVARYIPLAARRVAARPEEPVERPEPASRAGGLARYVPKATPSSSAKPERAAEPEWHKAYLVPALLKRPPIRHRGEPPEAGLDPFEFKIGGTALLIARVKIGSLRDDYRRDKGQRAMNGARNKNMKPGKTNRALFQRIGSEANRKASKSFSWPTTATVIRLHRRELFKHAGLSRSAPTRHRLPSALDRLTQPTTKHLPPLLLTHGLAEDGRLRLEVNPEWVPRGGFDCVPWPAPGAVIGLRLYLFVFGTDQRNDTNTTISLENLYELLGIPKRHGWRTLGRALFLVNEHLAWLHRAGMLKRPIQFEFVMSRDGKRCHIAKMAQQEAEPAKPQADTATGDSSVMRRAS
jgi:hypothetical protein